MSSQILSTAIQKLLESNHLDQKVQFLWHVGEPLIAGIPFYERVVELIELHEKGNRIITNTIQTNGTLLDSSWCQFLADHDFSVGLSVDGPAILHDKQRKTWGGRGTHNQVMCGYQILRNYNIRCGALCVLTRESLNYPDEIFNFFRQNGFDYVGFNIEEIENAHSCSSLNPQMEIDFNDVKASFHKFFSRIYDLWVASDYAINIRELSGMCRRIYQRKQNPSFFPIPDEVRSIATITIQANGNITTNSPELAGNSSDDFGDFVVGNILECDIGDIFNSIRFQKLQQHIKKGVYKCFNECQYFGLCGGGFSSNKFSEHGSFVRTETVACILSKQIVASVVLEKLLAL